MPDRQLARVRSFAQANPSFVVMVVANLVPAVGVLFFGWDALAIVLLYWAENAVIGIFNVLKMAFARPDSASVADMLAQVPLARRHLPADLPQTTPTPRLLHGQKLAIIPFFVVHYSVFMTVHLAFILVLLGNEGERFWHGPPSFAGTLRSALSPGILIALGGLVFEHAYAFYTEYWRGGEYRRTLPVLQMFKPYGHVVAIHLAIMAGAFLFVSVGLPQPMVLVLVALKTVLEITSARRKARPASP